MRLRLDRYREVQGRLEWTSVLLLVFGGFGILVGTFSLFVGVIMFFAPPDPEGGVLWQHRSAIFLSVFTGLFPLIVSGIMVWRGVARRNVLQLVSLGGAVFWDTARAWGPGSGDEGWHHDAGFGLRLSLPHSSLNAVARFDVSWPIVPDIDGRHGPAFSFGSGQAF